MTLIASEGLKKKRRRNEEDEDLSVILLNDLLQRYILFILECSGLTKEQPHVA
ncbi:unnamed protein product [Arabidopsis lyrata]|nr:unnamed protein product [Arabidopsis lyrata]